MKGKGNVAAGRNQASSDKSATWVNVPINNDVAHEIEEWAVDDLALLDGFANLVLASYEVRCKLATDGEGFMCLCFPIGSDHPNGGGALSAYGPTPRDALKVLLYKHYVILSGDWQVARAIERPKFR